MKSEGLSKTATVIKYFNIYNILEYLFNIRIRGLPPGTCHHVNCTSRTELLFDIDLSSGFDLEVSSNDSKQDIRPETAARRLM